MTCSLISRPNDSRMPHSLDSLSRQAVSTIEPKLLTRVAKGDRQALSQLYDQSSALLYTLSLRILGNPTEAADLLHELYIDIAKKTVRYDAGRGTAMTWLLTLTRGRAIDRLRTRTSRMQATPNEMTGVSPATQMSDQTVGAFEPAGNQQLRGTVSDALAHLPDTQQQVIELAYYEGLSHWEIAERLNQPPGTVKTRIKLGMSRLREALQSSWERDAQG